MAEDDKKFQYFTHVSYFFELVNIDIRLNSHHICIYIVLLHFWNKNRFVSPLMISKEDMLHYTKFGSTHTYYRCIKELHTWGYITYVAGKNAIQKSQIYMFEFTALHITQISDKMQSVENAAVQNCTDANMPCLEEQKCDSTVANMHRHRSKYATNNKTYTYRHNKDSKEQQNELKNNVIPNFESIEKYFLQNNSSSEVAEKFQLYYNSVGWVNKNNQKIVDWQSTAKLWIQKEFKPVEKNINPKSNNYDKKF